MRSRLAAASATVVVSALLVGCEQRDALAPSAAPAFGRAVGSAGNAVTGSGLVDEGGVIFRATVAAQKSGTGEAWGSVVVNLDLSVFDLGRIVFRGPVSCLDVDGTSAWIGAAVTNSTNPDIIPVGTNTILLVRDLGGNAQDVMHGELYPPDVACTDRPAQNETVVLSGNFTVR